jgi:hypothetical protein
MPPRTAPRGVGAAVHGDPRLAVKRDQRPEPTVEPKGKLAEVDLQVLRRYAVVRPEQIMHRGSRSSTGCLGRQPDRHVCCFKEE